MPNCLFLFGVFLFLIGSLLYNTLSEPYAEEVNYAFSFLAVSFLTLFYSFFQKSEKCKITILDVGLIGFVIYALTRLCIHDVSYFSSADICCMYWFEACIGRLLCCLFWSVWDW